MLNAICQALDHEIDRNEARFPAGDSTERASIVRRLRQLHAHAQVLHLHATPLSSGLRDSAEPQLGLRYFIDEAVSALTRADVDVVLVADADYMYSVYPRPFEALSGRLSVGYPANPPLALYYPAQEAETVLLHMLLVHEIAHRAVRDHGLVADVYAALTATADLDRLLAEATAGVVADRGVSPIDARIDVEGYVDRWLEEILCDALAQAYLGPTYVFVFAALVLSIGTNQPGDDHPATSLRIQLLLEDADSTGWKDAIVTACPEIARWLDAVGATTRGIHVGYPDSLDQAIVLLAPTAHEVARRHLGPSTFAKSVYESQRADLQNLFDSGVLPAQLPAGTAPDRRAMLLSGIFFLIAEHGDSSASLHTILADATTQQFLSKALEMSIVLNTWQQI